MPLPSIKLKPQRTDRVAHPWVYDNEIASGPSRDDTFEDGGLVKVIDSRGIPAGIGYLNSRSKIAVRYLTRDVSAVIDRNFWQRRINAAAEYRRERYRGRGGLPPAYRLAHGEADGLPGLVVDVYVDWAVVQFLARGLEPWRDTLIAAIAEATGAHGVYERSDSAVRRLEGLEERTGLLWGDEPPDRIAYEDDGINILVDVRHGGKTGLFLDQRENQRAAAAEAGGRDVLNCFAYTGLFSLRAAGKGAKAAIDVESSDGFNALNSEQWSANRFAQPHTIVAENVFDYLRAHERTGERHDMIVLDPPAFTKNRASREGAARGYNEINRMALRMLRPAGVLITCSCSHHLTAQEFREIVENAARDAGRSVRLVAQHGQPPDHPVLIAAPESEYLKCLILAVE